MFEEDGVVGTLVNQLYRAWTSNASALTYSKLRDRILAQHDQIDTCIATLRAVVNVAYPRIAESDHECDAGWQQLFKLADTIEVHDQDIDDRDTVLGKRRRTYGQSARTRNLAVVAALWSSDVLRYYGLDNSSQGHAKMLRACAMKFPRFTQDFCPRLNCLLLSRHCDAIKHGRRKSLNEAAIQPHGDFELGRLQSATPDTHRIELWVTSVDGQVPIDSEGTLLKDVRPHHFHLYLLQKDSYGMLVSRSRSSYIYSFPNTPPSTRTQHVTSSNETACVTEAPNMSLPPHDGPNLSLGSRTDVAETLGSFFENPQQQESVVDTYLGGYFVNTPMEAVDTCGLASSSGDAVSWIAETVTDVDLDLRVDEVFDCHNIALGPFEQPSQLAVELYRPSRDHHSNTCEQSVPHSEHQQSLSHGDIADITGDIAHSGYLSLLVPPCNSMPAMPNQEHQDTSLSMQMPYKRTKVQSEVLEDKLRNTYSSLISTHIERISSEAATANVTDEVRSRAHWLTPTTQWATLWTSKGCGVLPGRCLTPEDADVLYYSLNDFLIDSGSGKVFRKPIIIKEKFADSGMHTVQTMALGIQDTSRTPRLDVKAPRKESPHSLDLKDFASLVRASAEEQGGLSVINLHRGVGAHRPLLTMLTRFHLLESLVQRTSAEVDKNAERLYKDDAWLFFNGAGLAGSFSGTRVDAFAGMWMRNIYGVKLWLLVPEKDMKSEWNALQRVRVKEWVPDGRQRLVVLEQDDVLFVPPGLRIVHAAYSPNPGLVQGGRLWDDLNVVPTLRNLRWYCESSQAKEEVASSRLPSLLFELEKFVMDQPQRFCGDVAVSIFEREFADALEGLKKKCNPVVFA